MNTPTDRQPDLTTGADRPQHARFSRGPPPGTSFYFPAIFPPHCILNWPPLPFRCFAPTAS